MLLTNGRGGGLSGLQERHQGGMCKSPAGFFPGMSVLGPLIPLCAPFPPTGALEIGQALPIHTGRYTCTARNAAGMAHKHVVLTVQGKRPWARQPCPGGRGAGGGLGDSLGEKTQPAYVLRSEVSGAPCSL